MAEEKEVTEQDVREFVAAKTKEAMLKTVDAQVENIMSFKFSMFGEVSAKDFGAKQGWNAVMANFRRMYGG